MNCHVCGSTMWPLVTDLLFKVRESSTVITGGLPTLQCESCREHLIEDTVMGKVEAILENAGAAAGLEVVSFAA